MECHKFVESVCSRSHRLSRPCFKKDFTCRVCEAEDHRQEMKRQRDHKLEIEREIKQKEYARQLTELQDEIAHERRMLRLRSEQDEREKVLRQHQQDLENLRDTVKRTNDASIKGPSPTIAVDLASTIAATHDATMSCAPNTDQTPAKDQNKAGLDNWNSSAGREWEHQKDFEGAHNEALDSLMAMVGLEDVKDKFLSIKSRIDTGIRQNIDMKEERFGAALLGNPGTGARLLSFNIL